MTTKDWLTTSCTRLIEAQIQTVRLDCLVLLEDATGHNRSWLLAHPEFELTPEQFKQLEKQIKQRIRHEPLAYIRGKTEFYGREFVINKHVLEPRPESETMIDLLKSLGLYKPHIIDIGAGSGALGITAAMEIPGSTVDLTDIDPKCLKVARQNQELHKVTAGLFKADLLDFKPRFEPSVILANLPYVPDDFRLNQAAMNEPKHAIFGGADGLDLYRKLFAQLTEPSQRSHKNTHHDHYLNANFLHLDSGKPLYVLTESLPKQHKELAKIAHQAKFKLAKTEDFIQLFSLES